MDLSEADLSYECPVCLGHILPPVFQCHDGHLICDNCLPKLTDCPVCRDVLPKKRIRNLETEKIIKRVTHPCPFEEKGCRARMKYDAVEDHKFDCPYGTFELCSIFRNVATCNEQIPQIPYSDFRRHLENAHKFMIHFPKDQFGVRHNGFITIQIPTDRNRRACTFYFGSINHERREALWAFKFLMGQQVLVWHFYVLRGKAFVSRCNIEMAVRDQNERTRVFWSGPCLSLQRTLAELNASFSISMGSVRRWCTKVGNEERLNIWWRLTIDDDLGDGNGSNLAVGTSATASPASDVKAA